MMTASYQCGSGSVAMEMAWRKIVCKRKNEPNKVKHLTTTVCVQRPCKVEV